jgi:uncharacterized membrane protein
MPQRPAPPWMHAHHWGHAWWAGGFLSLLSTLAELALLVGLIWLALRWLLPYLRPRINAIFGLFPAMPSAFEILRQRYAAGEIDAWTFEHMWERLQASYQQEPVSALADARFDRREAARQRARRTQRLAQARLQAPAEQRGRRLSTASERRPARSQRAARPD